jgi:hypothetical protein
LGDLRSVDIHPLIPPVITSTPPLGGQVGTPYTYAADASGSTPIAWTLPLAPSWLQVSASGVVSGTPPQAAVYQVVLHAANVGGANTQYWSVTVAPASAQPRIVIPLGALWSYFKGTSDPGAQWANLGYPETGWLAGPSGFGYGDSDDATVLPDMQGSYSTVYTRHTFQLANAAAVTEFSLVYRYDDGFAVFLNGTRLFARNAPSSILPTSFATANHEAGTSDERSTFTDAASRALLRDGANVLAVVGLNVTLTSSDLTLRIALDVRETFQVPADAGGLAAVWGPAPNPFDSRVVFRYESASRGAIRLEIFDVTGRLVRRILGPDHGPGTHTLPWDGHDAHGRRQPAGVYFYRLTAPDGVVLSHGKLARSR